MFRCPGANRWQRFRPMYRPCVQARSQSHLRQRCLGCDRATGVAQMRKTAQSADGQRGNLIQSSVDAPIRRQNRKRDALGPAQSFDLLQAV